MPARRALAFKIYWGFPVKQQHARSNVRRGCRALQSGLITYMQASSELSVSPELHVYPLIQAEFDQIKGLLYCGVLVRHTGPLLLGG